MKIEEFYLKIKNAVENYSLVEKCSPLQCGDLIYNLEKLINDDVGENTLKITRMTILFEGFYQSIADTSPLKKTLSAIRLERWGNHFGTPTITFLLTYSVQIEQTKKLFGLASFLSSIMRQPWEIETTASLVTDTQNDIMIDESSTAFVDMPLEDEKTGQFLKTNNPTGGFTTTPCDPVSQKFIEYVNEIAKKDGVVLEVGAAFGAASLEALATGATVFCNDIDSRNLAVVKNRYLKKLENHQDILTNDNSKLILVPGSFPNELAGLPKNYFDAILICRVLHFFTGAQIEKSLEQLSAQLKPGGKLFVVCETPFLKNWQAFIQEHEKRKEKGIRWPGEINNPVEYESSGRAAALPKFVHWITKEILGRSLEESKFGVEHLSYIDRSGQFPDDLLLDGRESVGAVAAKPY